ncbi:MAG: HAMP domain-containing histidine kinase [Saccharofermentans sp.]|nr:HAMP domain-containing histidine kinase [Saccharofermentans sp.]
MIWQLLTIVLTVICVALLLMIFNNRSQIKSIRDQVHFISRNDTNKRVSFYGKSRSMSRLAKDINYIIDNYNSKELEIKKQDKEIKDTLTNMSHDIRTPLTSLKGYFELLEESEDPEEQARYRRIISERIDSLEEILEMMFFYTKVSNVNYQVSLESLNMSEIVMHTLFSYFDDFEKSGLTPNIDIDENLNVIGNEQSIKRIMQNLIKNCLVHGDSSVDISLKPSVTDSKTIILIVSNGVRENDIPDPQKVFDRFYKADNSRHVSSSGIGLSVAKKLTEAMNGKIWAEYKDNLFSISVELPAI